MKLLLPLLLGVTLQTIAESTEVSDLPLLDKPVTHVLGRCEKFD